MNDATKPTGDPAEPAQPAFTPPAAKPADVGGGTGGGWAQWLKDHLLLFALIFVAGIFILIISSVFVPYLFSWTKNVDRTLLRELEDTQMARGLITFLVAVSTVSIALIMIVYVAITSETGESLKERFAFSKEILTLLIGILGTIIGFYFGATQGHDLGALRPGTPTTLTLESLSINPPTPGTGGTVILTATLSGGQPPYSYAISFKPDTVKEIDNLSPNGTISQAIKLDGYDPAKPLDIMFLGRDATGAISGNQIHLAATP